MIDDAATTPEEIDVDRPVAITITWQDGHVSRYGLPELRRSCPCAGCKVERTAGTGPAVVDDLSIVDVKLAGAWGITPMWSDGHHTGIYSWDNLRDVCPCSVCATSAARSGNRSG
jgi:DUF971 family protein